MFLRMISKRLQSIRGDEGSVLIAVIGIMVFGLITSALILSSVVGATSYTSATRAGVQSQASADAGLAAARAGLELGTCISAGAVYASAPGAVPEYRAVVHRYFAGGWVQGCPATAAEPARILVNGAAAAGGLAGYDSRDNSFVEAMYAGTVIDSSGSAVYIYSGSPVNSLTVTSSTGAPSNVQIPGGNFACTSAGVIEGDVIVSAGNVDFTNTCHIKGSVRVAGSITFSAAVTVDGDLVAAGGGVSMSNSTITIGGDVHANGGVDTHARVMGDLVATGGVTVQGAAVIEGNLRAGGTLRIEGRVIGDASTPATTSTTVFPTVGRVGGSLTVGGGLDTWGHSAASGATEDAKKANHLEAIGAVGGQALYAQPGLVAPSAPPAPSVPDWVDVSYDLSKWTGFTPIVWSGDCQVGSWNRDTHPTYNAIKNATTPIVVDARACAPVYMNNTPLSVKTDVAIYARSITLGGSDSDVTSADGAPHQMWFIVPDGAPGTAGPQCTGGAGSISTNGPPEVVAPVSVFAYTPCSIALNNGVKWRGQLYARTLSTSSGDSLAYDAIGVPGYDLDGGGGGGGAGTARELVSVRNIDDPAA